MIKFLMENWVAKLVSFVLAVGLWYYAVGEEGIEVTRTIPLEIKLEHEKLSVVGSPKRFILATLQAPRSLLANLTSDELKAEHRIKKIDAPGDYSFRPEARDIKLPSEQIRVVNIQPEVIQVKIDEVIVQKLEIEPNFLGEPAIGYRLEAGEVQQDPTAVLVEGPKSQVEKLGKIKTQPIDLVGRVRSFRKTVRVETLPGLNLLTESLVDVYVPIREAIGEKTFEKISVKILGPTGALNRISVEPAEVSLVLRGSPKELDPLELKNISAFIDVTDLTEGTHEVPLQTFLPPGVFLKENPPVLKVTVQRKSVLSLT